MRAIEYCSREDRRLRRVYDLTVPVGDLEHFAAHFPVSYDNRCSSSQWKGGPAQLRHSDPPRPYNPFARWQGHELDLTARSLLGQDRVQAGVPKFHALQLVGSGVDPQGTPHVLLQ